ncbi:MAG: cobalamin biosynthesis protein [Victivallaceae bacterium]|nr:cobalamin biosynthesis protein [Victivallaceae bacterium]MDD3116566.1 cobalamin biosynthesis protein [Victivallaceae bacterium]MDD4317896.1 cobalamin biosynthesis protein [Victivallaceae bacterium]MDD5663644.1 cobalamin biosynthesis protein [Victivallaceae bacterium]NLK83474.1 hypothetical protein [Lentisphaerota bacterium]
MNQLLIILGVTLILDFLLGDMQNRWYPILAFKRLAADSEIKLREYFGNTIFAGILGWLMLVPPTVLLCWVLVMVVQLYSMLNGILLASVLIWVSISMRGLLHKSLALIAPLRSGNLSVARRILGEMTRFSTARLISKELICFGIENLSVKLVGIVTSVFFWAAIGWIFQGVAGAAAGAVFARTVQVLEEQWGYCDGIYPKFGRFATVINHFADWLPARLTALSVAVAAIPKGRGKVAVATAWRHRNELSSSNSAWIKAAFAGALNLTLGGPREYPNGVQNYPYLGNSRAELKIADLKRAVWLAFAAVIVFLFLLFLLTALCI